MTDAEAAFTREQIAELGLDLADCYDRLDGTYDYCPAIGNACMIPLDNPYWDDMFRPHGIATYWVVRHPRSAP